MSHIISPRSMIHYYLFLNTSWYIHCIPISIHSGFNVTRHWIFNCRQVLYEQQMHNIDVIMTAIASQITSLTAVYSIVHSGAEQRKHQTPRHWPLGGEFTGPGEFPAQRTSNSGDVSIWWRHHGMQTMHERLGFIYCGTNFRNLGIILYNLPSEIGNKLKIRIFYP